jgi:hypothetical protein
MSKYKKSYALSGEEMMMLVDNKANLEIYPNIHKYKTLNDLLGPHKACILLYEWKKNYGHWTCVFQRGNTIEFFDSYGDPPDAELDYVPEHFAHVHNEDHDYLMDLIRKSGKKLEYNSFDFQEESKGTSTCGRHVAVRLAFREVPNVDYVLMFLTIGKDPDELVTYATNFI